jgi:hypothetical protein
MLIISGLATLNHMLLPVYGDPAALSIGWTGFSLYALVVLAIPFRRGERWAWYTSWILVAGFAAPIVLIPGEGMGVIYLIVAGLMTLCLLLTRSAFFQPQ